MGSEYGTKEVDFMNQNSFNRFHDSAENIRNKFLNALPVILYFLLMFYSVIFFFGMQYVMVVSLATLLFQVNYKKQHTVRSLLTLIAQQLFLLVLAYTATLHLASCLILNLIVPFWLIFSKASPFNQLGYFSSLMTFTFLQLMHVGWNGFITQLEAMSFCCAVFFAAVLINSRILHPKTSSEGTEQKSMALLGCVLEKTLKGEDTKDERASLFELQRQLYREAYQNRGRTYVVTPKGKLKYMFALLMQRSVYFVSGQSRLLMPRDDVSRELEFAYQIAGYMKEAGKTDFMEGSTEELQRRGRMLLRKAEKGSDDFYRSSADFFRMFLLILRQQSGKNIVDERWEIPLKQRFKNRILYRMRPDTFEMRFALRMSVVLLVGMTFNMLSSEGHSYWFVMNAFLLLRPMYEDSRYRMKTRFIGTAAGCILITIILYFCNASVFHLLIAGIMVICMYTATPGTITHAAFVTCFALTMTTLAMGQTAAVFLRMAYVFASVLFVLVVNRFFFPTSLGSQFRYNLQMLFHMHHMYLRILEDALRNPPDYWRICDAQLQYHMVHGQIKQDLPKAAGAQEDDYLRILAITWRMASEIQQMIIHIRHRKRDAESCRILERYISYTDYVLNLIQEMLHLKKEKKMKNINGVKYQRYIKDEPELSRLMNEYAHNLSGLYALVLKTCRG